MNVLITRSAAQAVHSVNLLSSKGIFSYALPMIETALKTPYFGQSHYDICILTSPTAVAAFAPYAERVRGGKFIAVGEATARDIERRYGVDYEDIRIPDAYYAAEIQPLLKDLELAGKRVISPGAKSRIQDIGEFFTGSGAIFESPVIYETIPVVYDKDLVNSFLINYNISVVTFFSPSAVKAFFDQAGLPEGVRVAAIGSTTERSLLKRGISAIVPEKATAESLVEKLVEENNKCLYVPED